jgi:hypothetical protein
MPSDNQLFQQILLPPTSGGSWTMLQSQQQRGECERRISSALELDHSTKGVNPDRKSPFPCGFVGLASGYWYYLAKIKSYKFYGAKWCNEFRSEELDISR